MKNKPTIRLRCQKDLEKLDQEYEKARKRLIREHGKEKPDPNLLVLAISKLSGLRREMMRLESAEIERIGAKYRQTQRLPS